MQPITKNSIPQSIWGKTPTRFYRFIHRTERAIKTRPLRWCILGCADGKYVLSLVRRGHSVFAIDADKRALYGGKEGELHIMGLKSRLSGAGLENLVKIKLGNYVSYSAKTQYDCVFTSGSIHYKTNKRYPLPKIMSAIKRYVRPGGFLYIDYMLDPPSNIRKRKRTKKKSKHRHLITRETLESFFPKKDWKILSSKVLPEFKDAPHPGTPYWHYHQIGYFCASRLR